MGIILLHCWCDRDEGFTRDERTESDNCIEHRDDLRALLSVVQLGTEFNAIGISIGQ